jgi:predicted  nucleic acid-binding Zn-ribbon protein
MHSDLEKLITLEKTDREIARLRQEVATLPGRMAAIEQKLNTSKAQVEAARAKIKAGDANKRKYESEIQAQQQKISKYRDQSLEVKTNEQYRALMDEIGFAEKAIRDAEDKILEVMLDAEAQEKAAKAAEADLKLETAEIEKEKTEARAITARDEAELKEWNAKRDALRTGISEDILRTYDRVSKHRGTGVAEARDHKCTACQVMLRPQVYNEVRSNEMVVQCSSCQRILFYDPSKDVAVEADEHAGEQVWYYVPRYGEKGAFVVFINGKASSSRRVFDADSGLLLRRREVVRNQTFDHAFADDVQAGQPVQVKHPPNLDRDASEQLTSHLLFELQNQVELTPVAEETATKTAEANSQ